MVKAKCKMLIDTKTVFLLVQEHTKYHSRFGIKTNTNLKFKIFRLKLGSSTFYLGYTIA